MVTAHFLNYIVMHVFKSDLTEITSLDEFVDGGKYLAVGKEGIIKDKCDTQLNIFFSYNSSTKISH